ncbi:MAG TPA: hypothetical protein VFJ85_13250 [Acidimicrobiales bacterium]|nr:hypothetical protein [Acidimicrobiales bacterium]
MVEVVAPGRAWARSALAALGLTLMVAGAVIGGAHGIRDRLWHVAGAGAAPAPTWTDVVELQGDGSAMAAPFAVDARAVEWRVQWSCEYGHLLVEGAGPRPVVDTPCPKTGTGFATTTGPTALHVTTNGRWTLKVQQHVDPSKSMHKERM